MGLNDSDFFLQENVTLTAPSPAAKQNAISGYELPPGGFLSNGVISGKVTPYNLDASVDRSGIGAWLQIDVDFDTFVFKKSVNSAFPPVVGTPPTTTGRTDDCLWVSFEPPSTDNPPKILMFPGDGINQFRGASVWVQNAAIAGAVFQLWFVKDSRRPRSTIAEV